MPLAEVTEAPKHKAEHSNILGDRESKLLLALKPTERDQTCLLNVTNKCSRKDLNNNFMVLKPGRESQHQQMPLSIKK